MSATRPVPEAFHTITPHLVVRDGKRAMAFYEEAFGAQTLWCHTAPGGDKVTHACVRIGDTPLMLNDEMPEFGVTGPSGSTPVTLHLYVEDADAWWRRATGAGGEVVMPLADQFWGDRYGVLRDPFGHQWAIASHLEDLSDEEIAARQEKAFADQGPKSEGGAS